MTNTFQFEEKCPFYSLKKFININQFKEIYTQNNAYSHRNEDIVKKYLYNIIAHDVNAYCAEYNVEGMILPGDNIEIKTSLLSVYNDIPAVINLKRIDFDQWQAWIYSTPLMQFAICFDQPFYILQSSMTKEKNSRSKFETFFNKNCSQTTLTKLQNATADNILLPAGTYDYSGRYPLFARFSRNQRAAYPPYKLDMFVKSPADRASRLGRDVFVLGDSVEKARVKVLRQSIVADIEKTLDAIDDDTWQKKLQNAREGRDIAGEIPFGDHVFTLMLLRNRNRVLSSFGGYSVPAVVLQLYEKKFVRPTDSRTDDNAIWLEQMEWHGDLAADLAHLAGIREEDVDIMAILKNKNLEELCRQSQDAPAWFDSGLKARIPGRDLPVKIWGRMDYNPHSTKPYVLRLFSIWKPKHPLNSLATCFVSPFMDLVDMLHDPKKYDLLSVMQQFGDMFENTQSQEGEPLERVGFFKENEIYCGKTHFSIGKTKKNYICAYFSKCNYYKGTATPYFLNFFYYEDPYAGMDGSSRMQKAVEYMLIGNMIQNSSQPRPNVLASIREFKKIQQKKAVSSNEENLFQLFLQAQKRAIVAQEQFRLEKAESIELREALLRRLFHQIGHYTSAISGNAQLAQKVKGDGQRQYFDSIIKITHDVNSSVEIFKVLTSEGSELRKRFRSSLIYGRNNTGTCFEDVRSLNELFYDSLRNGIGRILTERGRCEKTLNSYLAQNFTVERWEALEASEKNKYIEMTKKSLLARYPGAREQIEAISTDNLDREDMEEILNIWSHTSINYAYTHLDKDNNEQFSDFIRQYFFKSFSVSGTKNTYFDSNDDLSYNCIKSILDELCFNALKYAAPGGALVLECLHDEKKFILYMKNDIMDDQKYSGSSTGLQGCQGIVAMIGGEMNWFVEPDTGRDTARFAVSIRLNMQGASDDDRG